MPTQQQFQNLILSAELQMANLIEKDRLKMVIGSTPGDAKEIDRYNNNITALSYQVYGRVDYTSTTTLSLYDCLNSLVGVDTSTATLDPNFQSPTVIINNEIIGAPAVDYFYTEAQLKDAGGGNWYLEFNFDISNHVPIYLRINGVATTFPPLDQSFTPARIYGFSNNDPQSIILTVMTTI